MIPQFKNWNLDSIDIINTVNKKKLKTEVH